jgi:transposase
MRRIETEDWWDELVELKDEMSLRELAAKFNVTPGAISNALRRNRLDRKPAPSGPRAYRVISPKQDDSLPPEPEESVSTDPLVRPGSKDYLLEPAFHLLGHLPDAAIAKRCRVSVRTVASYRARHNITGYSGPRKRTVKKKVHQSKIDPFAHLVGRESDNEVARKAGVTLNAVRHYRITRGIVQAGNGNRPLEGSASTTNQAWLVRFVDEAQETTRVLLGVDLLTIVTRAESANLGTVVSVEKVGEVLDV